MRRFTGTQQHHESLDHLRIAHLTDLHVGRVTPMEAQMEAVRLTNASEPDAVVITGDFVCHTQAHLDELTYVVQSLDAPVFAVLGNHDYWSGASEVRWALKRAHAEVLDNVWTSITLKHQSLQVLGLDDAYTGHASWRQATKGLDPRKPTLGLSHIAEEADALWHHGVSLVLSGHTHAGQITVARLHEITVGRLVGHKYVHGLYGRRRPLQDGPLGAVYVGAGVGAAVMPLRLGERAKREVTIFELGLEPGSIDEHHAEQLAHPRAKAQREAQAPPCCGRREEAASPSAEEPRQQVRVVVRVGRSHGRREERACVAPSHVATMVVGHPILPVGVRDRDSAVGA